MEDNNLLEEIIIRLKREKKRIIAISLVIALTLSGSISWFNLNSYAKNLKFHISNPELLDYNTIAEKNISDISSKEYDLHRIQRYAFSIDLINSILDSLNKNEELLDDQLIELLENKDPASFLSNLYEVRITPLEEFEVEVRHNKKEVVEFLSHALMLGMNRINNQHIEDFKLEKIEISKKQIQMLELEKSTLKQRISTLKEEVKKENRGFNLSTKRGYSENSNIITLSANEYKDIELSIHLQRVSNIESQINALKKIVSNELWSIERLKDLTPFITKDLAAKNKFTFYNLFITFVLSFSMTLFIITLIISLLYRYETYIHLFFGKYR